MSYLSKLFNPSNISVTCSICGKKIGMFEKRFYFNTPQVPKGMTLWICEPCSKIKGKAIILPDGRVKIQKPDGTVVDTASSKEFKKRCNTCGHIYCYTQKDLDENIKNAKKGIISGVAGAAGALSGHYAASAINSQTANNQLDKVVDYGICPKCHSRDISEISDEEFKMLNSNANKESTSSTSISQADELKKFKELLDNGIITQDEFDQKKKQLLDL